MYAEISDKDHGHVGENFEASVDWLSKCMKCHNLSLRRKTSIAQKDPYLLVGKIVFYILRVRRLCKKH